MQIGQLRAPKGANKKRKRVGRGESSGHGKTAGRGGKGQTARTGKGKPALGFEGGQMPMYRRMPKRGFKNKFAIKRKAFNLDELCYYFASEELVDLQSCRAKGLIGHNIEEIRILGRGEVTHKLQIAAHHFSQSAKEKLDLAGAQLTLLGV